MSGAKDYAPEHECEFKPMATLKDGIKRELCGTCLYIRNKDD